MPVHLVTYQLNNNERDYSQLFVAIRGNALQWWHYLPHVWIVSTPMNADQFARTLIPFIERGDRLLVKRLAREHQGWLPKEAWDWLEDKTY